MSSSPAFQTYVNDFLGSAKVAMMTTAEVGAYWLLLLLDWQETGFVYESELLAGWCRMTPSRFERAWDRILRQCFVERAGRLYNPRLARERKKQADFRRRCVAGGKARAKAMWGNKIKGNRGGLATPKPPLSTPSPSPSPSPITTTTPAIDAEIDTVLAAYSEIHPRRKIVGKKPRSLVRTALKDFTTVELVEAIKGNAADLWHKEIGKHELSYVLRDAEKISDFRVRFHGQSNPRLIGVGGEWSALDLAAAGIKT